MWLDDDPVSNEKIRKDIPGYAGVAEVSDGVAMLRFEFSSAKAANDMDVYCFTSVAAITSFMLRPENVKFASSPSSSFRIISNRRLFIGGDGLCAFLDNPCSNWGFAYPSTMIFYGGNPKGLEFVDNRPNTVKTTASRDCVAFLSFGSIFPSIRSLRESLVSIAFDGGSAAEPPAPPARATAASSSPK